MVLRALRRSKEGRKEGRKDLSYFSEVRKIQYILTELYPCRTLPCHACVTVTIDSQRRVACQGTRDTEHRRRGNSLNFCFLLSLVWSEERRAGGPDETNQDWMDELLPGSSTTTYCTYIHS